MLRCGGGCDWTSRAKPEPSHGCRRESVACPQARPPGRRRSGRDVPLCEGPCATRPCPPGGGGRRGPQLAQRHSYAFDAYTHKHPTALPFPARSLFGAQLFRPGTTAATQGPDLRGRNGHGMRIWPVRFRPAGSAGGGPAGHVAGRGSRQRAFLSIGLTRGAATCRTAQPVKAQQRWLSIGRGDVWRGGRGVAWEGVAGGVRLLQH